MGDFNRGGRRDDRSGPRRFGGGGHGGGQRGGHGGGRGGDFGQREMHKAVCAECGQECEVPFKPREDRPVFCRDCFRKKREQEQGRY